jgi:hypothetical protein
MERSQPVKRAFRELAALEKSLCERSHCVKVQASNSRSGMDWLLHFTLVKVFSKCAVESIAAKVGRIN